MKKVIMKKWRIVIETENGCIRYRATFADSLDEASDKVRSEIPITARIVSVEEIDPEETVLER